MNDIKIIFKNSNSNRLPISLVVESLPYPAQVAEEKVKSAIRNNELIMQGQFVLLPENKTAEIKKAFHFLRSNEQKLPLITLMKGVQDFQEKFQLKYYIFNYEIRTKAINEFAYITPTSSERKCLNKILQS